MLAILSFVGNYRCSTFVSIPRSQQVVSHLRSGASGFLRWPLFTSPLLLGSCSWAGLGRTPFLIQVVGNFDSPTSLDAKAIDRFSFAVIQVERVNLLAIDGHNALKRLPPLAVKQ